MGLFTRKVVEVVDATAGRNGYGKPTNYHFSKRGTPTGGANVYAFDTLQLPMYTAIGWGVANRADFRTINSAPRVEVVQGVTEVSLGSPGTLSGQFISQPLLSRTSYNPGQLNAVDTMSPSRNTIPQGALS